MNNTKLFLIVFSLFLISTAPVYSGASFNVPNTDAVDESLVGFFDLRDRETFIQVTNFNTDPAGNNLHIQIFDVSNNCNENNFFDLYTPTDTHIYNLRDIITNDGNPSGIVLPEDAYGVIFVLAEGANDDGPVKNIFGNMRILDDNGYEYRTNLQGEDRNLFIFDPLDEFATFNFNTIGGVTLSDVVGIPFDSIGIGQQNAVAEILDIWVNLDVDIYNLDEVPFSCRNVVFACIDQDNPLLEELLEEVADSGGSSSVASFEYGINDAIPHSKSGELLCPGNQISDGFVRFEMITKSEVTDDTGIYFIGLNNGNGRGSMDAIWFHNTEIPPPDPG